MIDSGAAYEKLTAVHQGDAGGVRMILDGLAAHARERVAAAKARVPLEEIRGAGRSPAARGFPV